LLNSINKSNEVKTHSLFSIILLKILPVYIAGIYNDKDDLWAT